MVSRKNNLPKLLDGSLYHLVKTIDSFFDEPFKQFDAFFHHNLFKIDWYETSSDVIVEAELPGYKREQIQIEILGDRLRIAAENSQLAGMNPFEQSYSHQYHASQRMERFITLPFLISEKDTRATYKDGVLRIITPKQHSAKRFINIE
ncbi:hypothetical protein AC623_14350 [Bacillus sp. FJAT-27231]|uniref:Hsp20/alpha crystallin family protein n=1 Tax=Bacillus sp. FJAT-27231 TaxID=1679168 RepID=UPI00067140FA|nr:Hsp20/alpha crystallin family protein [Bacillus sp. FJAT-27231]KMY54967.1 hypothetical protein AC623_14350 [Bacillus sp. FJAT-27231]